MTTYIDNQEGARIIESLKNIGVPANEITAVSQLIMTGRPRNEVEAKVNQLRSQYEVDMKDENDNPFSRFSNPILPIGARAVVKPEFKTGQTPKDLFATIASPFSYRGKSERQLLKEEIKRELKEKKRKRKENPWTQTIKAHVARWKSVNKGKKLGSDDLKELVRAASAEYRQSPAYQRNQFKKEHKALSRWQLAVKTAVDYFKRKHAANLAVSEKTNKPKVSKSQFGKIVRAVSYFWDKTSQRIQDEAGLIDWLNQPLTAGWGAGLGYGGGGSNFLSRSGGVMSGANFGRGLNYY